VVNMKTVSLPEKISDDLAKTAEELTFMAKKPISQSMAINLLIEVYHAHLNNPCALDAFSQQLKSIDIMSPEEFDKYWDEPQEVKDKKKTKRARKTTLDLAGSGAKYSTPEEMKKALDELRKEDE
jgi:hypothetical protein